jgi:hypothetical protein
MSLFKNLILFASRVHSVRGEDGYGQVLAGRLNQRERGELMRNLVRRAHMHMHMHRPGENANAGERGSYWGSSTAVSGKMEMSRSFADLLDDLGI